MQQISYGFMNPHDGCFLHVFQYNDDATSDGIGYDLEFTIDADDVIYETDDPAAILDTVIGMQNGRYLSEEALFGGLPGKIRVDIKDYVPVAFVRELRPIIEGGEALVVSTTVRLVRFDNTADPKSVWLDDIENRFEPNPNTNRQLAFR